MSFPRYPKYKDSGVEWLGEVPEHWDIISLRFAFQNLDHKRVPLAGEDRADVEKNFPYYGASGIIDYVADYLFDENLILVAEDGANLLSRSSPLAFIATGKYWVNNHAHILKPTSGNYEFWEALLQVHDYSPIVTGAAQPKLTADRLGSIRLPKPSTDEQTLIASFLVQETSKIDALVGEQRRLIELLKEKRQAVISHAVTKGLNPNAPLKPSGIEWLGDVPEHWEVKPLRMIANVVRGASPRPAGDPRYFGGDAFPWVTVAEITKDDLVDLTETDSLLTEEGAQNSKLFPMGTLLYSNSGATLGVPKILQINACANDGVVAFERLSRDVHPQFLYHYLASITEAIREKVKQGSGQPNLNTDIVKALRFAIPPMEEQREIVGRITDLAAQFGSLTAEVELGIELLQERRTAIISAAVTGKIDVRNVKPDRSQRANSNQLS